MAQPRRGEVWLVDLGMAAKTRPCLVLSALVPAHDDRALATVIPHTTSLRQSQFEIAVTARFLKPGAFLVQGIGTYPHAKFERRLGALSTEQMALIDQAVRDWLGL